jgi:hypothetical protein
MPSLQVVADLKWQAADRRQHGAVEVADAKPAAAACAMRGERIGVVDPLPTAASRLALSVRWLMAG